MNEKVKNILAGIGLVAGAVLAFLLGRGWNNPLRKRVSDAKDSVDSGRRTVGDIRADNRDAQDTAGRIADGVREADGLAQDAGRTVADARTAVEDGLRILEEAEKRSHVESR